MITEQVWYQALDMIDKGATPSEACKAIGCTLNTMKYKRERDPVFAELYEAIIAAQTRKIDDMVYAKCQRILESNSPMGHDLVKLWYQRMGALNGAEVNVINNGIMAVGNVNIDAREELARLEAEESRLAAILAGRAVQN